MDLRSNRTGRSPRARRLTIPAILLILLLAGCASFEKITLRVRDRDSGTLIEGARVTVRPLNFFLPYPPYAELFPLSHRSEHGITGGDGLVRLRVVSNGPNQIVAIHADYVPYRATIAPVGRDDLDQLRWCMEGEERKWPGDHRAMQIEIVAHDHAGG